MADNVYTKLREELAGREVLVYRDGRHYVPLFHRHTTDEHAIALRALAIAEVGEEVERAEADGLRGLVAEGLKLSHERVAALGEMLSASESKLSAALIAAEASTEQLRDVLHDCVMVMDEIRPDNWQPDFSLAWGGALEAARAALAKLKQAREG